MTLTFDDVKDNFIYLAVQHSIAIEITGEDAEKGIFEYNAVFYGDEKDELNEADFNAKVSSLGESVGLTKDKKLNRFTFVPPSNYKKPPVFIPEPQVESAE